MTIGVVSPVMNCHGCQRSGRIQVERHQTYQIPVHNGNKQTTTDCVTNERWNHALPDVISNGNLVITVKDASWDEVHVGNNVIEAESDKSKGRPPDGDDLGAVLSCGKGEKASKTHEPVTSDTAKEDLMPLWGDGFGGGESDDFGLVRSNLKRSTMAGDETSDEQRASKIAPEGDEPVLQHLENTESAVDNSKGCELKWSVKGLGQRGQSAYHERSGNKVRTSHDDHNEADGKDHGSQHLD